MRYKYSSKEIVSKSRYIAALISINLFIGACTFNNQYINKKADNEKGEAFVKKFYFSIDQKDYKNLDSITSEAIKKTSGPNAISKLAKFIDSKAGNYRSYRIVDFYNKTITGSINETDYNYKLKVVYDKGITDEIIAFKQQSGSQIKLYTYKVNSDLLVK